MIDILLVSHTMSVFNSMLVFDNTFGETRHAAAAGSWRGAPRDSLPNSFETLSELFLDIFPELDIDYIIINNIKITKHILINRNINLNIYIHISIYLFLFL